MPLTFNPFTGIFDFLPDTSTFVTVSAMNAAIAAATGNGGAALNTFLVSGGQVVWTSNYNFLVSAASYYINGVHYTSAQTTVTLDAAHATLDRLDAIVVDTTGTAVKVTGTAASQPVEPNIDPSTQLQLSLILVTHNTTQPAGTSTLLVYDENVGAAAEWNWSSSGTGWTLGSTNNPYNGTKDIEATNVASGAYILGTIGSSSINPNSYNFLNFFLRSKATWGTKTLQVRLFNSAGAVVGKTLTVGQGSYGFDSTVTSSYQQIAIPTSQFGVPSGTAVTQVQLTRAGTGTIGFYLDLMQWLGANGGQGTTLSTHNILSTTHSDTVAAAVVRGDIIVGNSTPAWQRLAVGGANTALLSNGTDPSYGTITSAYVDATIGTTTNTITFTNKRITKRVVTASDATSVTPNTDNADITYQANTQAAGTLTMNVDSGTPTNGQSWGFKIKSTNIQTFSWTGGAKGFAGGTVALPTASSGGGLIDYFVFIYDTVNSRWQYTGTAAGF